MKKILQLAFVLPFMSAFAQLPVDTLPGKRVAILEELTGIQCQYCPDGHAIAEKLAQDHPARFFAINVHAGGYAETTPDYTTAHGDSIDTYGNPDGYPAGGVNRGSADWAVGRGEWSGMVSTIIGQDSKANIALQGTLNVDTRQLTVDVEIYYTSAPSQSTQYLNIALVQDNIHGPQVDGGDFNPDGWYDKDAGIYNHQNMFRMYVNPTEKGEPITTSVGTVISKQYVTTLPDDVEGLALELVDIELIGFLTEDQDYISSIVTGGKAEMIYEFADGSKFVDLSAAKAHEELADYCTAAFTPKATISNSSSSNASIDTIVVGYVLDGDTTKETVYTTLGIDSNFTHTFSSINLTKGSHTIEYFSSASADNSSTDLRADNDISETDYVAYLGTDVITDGFTETFESYTVNSEVIDQSISLNFNDMNMGVGGEGAESQQSYKWYFRIGEAGDVGSIVWDQLDFSNNTNTVMVFDVAYALSTASKQDELNVYLSTDCGVTWTQEYWKKGFELTTIDKYSPVFLPDSGEWRWEKVDLSAYDGMSSVYIKMEAVSGAGGTLYVDDIFVGSDTAVGVSENIENIKIGVYPNPADKGFANIVFNNPSSSNVQVEILNNLGQVVVEKNLGVRPQGQVNERINISDLNSGIYFVNISVDNKTHYKKLSVR